jgi:hypothetical protein
MNNDNDRLIGEISIDPRPIVVFGLATIAPSTCDSG